MKDFFAETDPSAGNLLLRTIDERAKDPSIDATDQMILHLAMTAANELLEELEDEGRCELTGQ